MTKTPPLPDATIGRLMGLLETLRDTPGPDDMYRLAGSLQLELDDLVPLIDAAVCASTPTVASECRTTRQIHVRMDTEPPVGNRDSGSGIRDSKSRRVRLQRMCHA